MPQKTDLIRTKVKRAYQHIDQLEAACNAFVQSDPYKIATKRDPETRRLHYYVAKDASIPDNISLCLGDVIHNLRSALDHLAYQLVFVGTGGAGISTTRGDPFRHVYFPIFDGPKEYESGKMRKINGMTQPSIDAIDKIKPYKGGNDPLWVIHRLDNIDKHRLLITAGGQFKSMDIGPSITKTMAKSFEKLWPGNKIPAIDLWITPSDKLFPLKAGDDLFVDGPDAEPNENMKFAIEIAFGEPGILESRPILPEIKQMAEMVDSLILGFKPFL